MQTAWLEDLVALAKAGSLSAAAEARHLTRPAFGRRIDALEQWAGALLVERRRAPVAFTPAGQRLLRFAQEAVPAMAQLRADLRGLPAGAEQLVTLVTGRTLARTIAADWLARSRRRLAGAMVRIRTGSMAETLNWLEAGEADFMLAYHHPVIALRLSASTYLQRTVAHDRLVPLAKPELANTAAATGRALPYLAYAERLSLARLVSDHLVNHAAAPRLLQGVECDSADALLEYALKGLGVAWLPWSLAQGAHRARQLAVVGPKALQIGFEVRMVRPKKRLSPLAESLWEAVDIA